MRLAFFSPLPPAPTGIADYSVGVLQAISGEAEIDAFHDQPEVDAARLPPDVRPLPAALFEERHRTQPYDLAIYQMGNAVAHLYMYPFLARASGLLVLHDLVLHHSRARGFLDSAEARAYAADRGNPDRRAAALARLDEYRAELEYAYPGQGRRVAETHLGTTGDLLPYAYPLFRLPVEASRATACHNAFMAEAVRREVPGSDPVRVAMMMRAAPVAAGEVRALRERLGISGGDLVIGSFGPVAREKRVETVARAVARAAALLPSLRLLLVGPAPSRPALEAMLARLGLSGRAIVTGHVPFAELGAHISSADIVAHLRYPTARETSAALLRALAQGRPCVISALEHLAEVPEDAVARVAPDAEEEGLVQEIVRLGSDPDARRRLGERAAAFASLEHSLERCRADYLAAIETALARPPVKQRPDWPAHWRTAE